MSKDLKLLQEAVYKHRQEILDAERYIWKNAESGFKEWKTSKYLAERYEKAGYVLHYAGNIPGFYTDIDTGKPGPKIVVCGEMDALIIPDHPECDPETGAVHSCAHNCQSAALLGLALALKEPGVLDGLYGSIRLCAVPAEEMIESQYRSDLVKQGTIHYVTGKGEFLYRGYFDGCDIGLMTHQGAAKGTFAMGGTNNGCLTKDIEFIGKAAHAAACAQGINALHAATLAIDAINGFRDTFMDDGIRVHYIITKGGESTNVVPASVKMEMMVRARTTDMIANVNKKVNAALAAAGAALGVKVRVADRLAYAATYHDPKLNAVSVNAMKELHTGVEIIDKRSARSGSTDMGYLSLVMPSIMEMTGGTTGVGHSNNFYIDDPETGCVVTALHHLKMIDDLLSDDAATANDVIKSYKPEFSGRDEAVEALDKMNQERELVIYNEDGTITLNI